MILSKVKSKNIPGGLCLFVLPHPKALTEDLKKDSKVSFFVQCTNMQLITMTILVSNAQLWYFVTKIVLTYCEKKLFQVIKIFF